MDADQNPSPVKALRASLIAGAQPWLPRATHYSEEPAPIADGQHTGAKSWLARTHGDLSLKPWPVVYCAEAIDNCTLVAVQLLVVNARTAEHCARVLAVEYPALMGARDAQALIATDAYMREHTAFPSVFAAAGAGTAQLLQRAKWRELCDAMQGYAPDLTDDGAGIAGTAELWDATGRDGTAKGTLSLTHSFTHKANVRGWNVWVSPRTNYGCFEHDNGGEGGLWFDAPGDGAGRVDEPGNPCRKPRHMGPLRDSDGFSELPRAVAEGLQYLGCHVGADFLE